ncbi:hypothetical protein WME99_21110 [Sorangium sp. So ce136]|uniref:hypothetical protein n=1 Tax=Sorangium sp. So ce136 TaxID=3133284 RepID=UPI003F0F8B31
MRFSKEESVCFMSTQPIAETYLETAAASPAARSRSARARREAVVTAGSRRAEVGVGRSGGRSDVIPKQGSKRWMSLSKALTGVDGYLHLGSTRGYIKITWHVPLSGIQTLSVDVTVPDRLACLDRTTTWIWPLILLSW